MPGSDRRVVIVTGASRGLGREIALRFGLAGCRVVVNFRAHEASARSAADEIARRGGEAIAVRADVGRTDDVDRLIRETLSRFGSIDVLVNNAGVTRDALALTMTEAGWDSVLDTNLKGPFLCMRAAARTMEAQRSGHIISVSSLSAIRGRKGQANYAASKAGLIGLSKTAAKEFGAANIQVNCVLPGFLPTDMGNQAPGDILRNVLEDSVLGRTTTASEVASFVYHLSLMQNVSGQVFNLDSRIW